MKNTTFKDIILQRPIGAALLLEEMARDSRCSKKDIERVFLRCTDRHIIVTILATRYCNFPVVYSLPIILRHNSKVVMRIISNLSNNFDIHQSLLSQLFEIGSHNKDINKALQDACIEFVKNKIPQHPESSSILGMLLSSIHNDTSQWPIVATILEETPRFNKKLMLWTVDAIRFIISVCHDDCVAWAEQFIQRYYNAKGDVRSKLARKLVLDIGIYKRSIHNKWSVMLARLEKKDNNLNFGMS